MTDAPTAQAVHLLLSELEASVTRAHELRRSLRAEELTRKRLIAALDPAIATLPGPQAERLRARMHSAIYARALIGARAAKTRMQAIMEYLAANSGEIVKVAEVTTHLERSGFSDLAPGYASDTLKRFEAHGIVTKTRFARYRVNEAHPEIMSLHLKALEADVGRRKPSPPARARDESPNFDAPAHAAEEDAEAEIAANQAEIDRRMAEARRRWGRE